MGYFLGVCLSNSSVVCSEVHISLFLSLMRSSLYFKACLFTQLFTLYIRFTFDIARRVMTLFLWLNVRKHFLCESYTGNEKSFTKRGFAWSHDVLNFEGQAYIFIVCYNCYLFLWGLSENVLTVGYTHFVSYIHIAIK